MTHVKAKMLFFMRSWTFPNPPVLEMKCFREKKRQIFCWSFYFERFNRMPLVKKKKKLSWLRLGTLGIFLNKTHKHCLAQRKTIHTFYFVLLGVFVCDEPAREKQAVSDDNAYLFKTRLLRFFVMPFSRAESPFKACGNWFIETMERLPEKDRKSVV